MPLHFPTVLLAALVAWGNVPGPPMCPFSSDQASSLEAPAAPADTVPDPDAYADPGTAQLMEQARVAYARADLGLDSYEARMWERIRVQVAGGPLRRTRELFQEERAALVRWESDGSRTIRWEGARRDVPVAGRRSADDDEQARELASALRDATGSPVPLFMDPGDGRVLFGGGHWALHPLADTAHHHYRYSSGDTLRITLPADDRTVTLVEARVEPRRTDPRLVSGSLWIDAGSGSLVRAAYRPARPFELVADLGDGGRGSWLLPKVRLAVEEAVVDHGYHDLRWWLPRGFALNLEVRVGGSLRFPAAMEWLVDEYHLNEARSPELDVGPLPDGWRTKEGMIPRPGTEDEGDSISVRRIVPPAQDLHLALSSVDGQDPSPTKEDLTPFSDDELQELRVRLDRLAPARAAYYPRLLWGLEEGLLRYNRVEGLSAGVAGEAPLGFLGRGIAGRVELRMGGADVAPRGRVELTRGDRRRGERVSIHESLKGMSDWEDPHTLSSSVSALVAGSMTGHYYRVTGVEVGLLRPWGPGGTELALFAERHRAARKHTDFHLTRWTRASLPMENLSADRGRWLGARGKTRAEAQPGGVDVFGSLFGEAARGVDVSDYLRLALSAGATGSSGTLAWAVEGGAGGSWGERPPVQRGFHLGGPRTVRGLRPGELAGPAYTFLRTEVSRGPPAFRVSLFGDVGWVRRSDRFSSPSQAGALGLGLSFLDGLLRLDLARRVGGPGGTRLHFYLDGLL